MDLPTTRECSQEVKLQGPESKSPDLSATVVLTGQPGCNEPLLLGGQKGRGCTKQPSHLSEISICCPMGHVCEKSRGK